MRIFILLALVSMSQYVSAEVVKLVCWNKGMNMSGTVGSRHVAGEVGTSTPIFHDREAHRHFLEYDGISIRKSNSRDFIVSYETVKERDHIVTASTRSELDDAVVGSITIDLRSGHMHEVIFTNEASSNVYATCDIPDKISPNKALQSTASGGD